MAFTNRSNRSVERAGGHARIQVSQTIHNETSFGARESTRATRYGFDFHNMKDSRGIRRFTSSQGGIKDGVSIGRYENDGP